MFNNKLFKGDRTKKDMKESVIGLFKNKFLLLLLLIFITVPVFAGNIIVNEDGIQSDNYYSSDGDVGLTQNVTYAGGDGENYTLIIKNGLIINTTSSGEGQSNSSFPTENLVSYYKLDETSGVVVDELGTNNGTNNGATRDIIGKIENAFNFSSNDWVNMSYSSSLDFDSSFSTSYWIKYNVNPTSTMYVIGNHDYTNKNGWGATTYQQKIRFEVYDGSVQKAVSANAVAVGGTWYHVVMVFDDSANNMYMYIDNVKQSEETTVNQISQENNPVWIGAHYNGELYLNAIVDEVGIWSRALSSTEVSDLYNSGSGLTYP